MSCSPSSLIPKLDSGVVFAYPSKASGFGGYPCFMSGEATDVTSDIFVCRCSTVAFGSRVSVDWPFGPRTRRRISYRVCYLLVHSDTCNRVRMSQKWKRSPYVAPYPVILKDGGIFSDTEYVQTVSG